MLLMMIHPDECKIHQPWKQNRIISKGCSILCPYTSKYTSLSYALTLICIGVISFAYSNDLCWKWSECAVFENHLKLTTNRWIKTVLTNIKHDNISWLTRLEIEFTLFCTYARLPFFADFSTLLRDIVRLTKCFQHDATTCLFNILKPNSIMLYSVKLSAIFFVIFKIIPRLLHNAHW